jgi:hypothetical protein
VIADDGWLAGSRQAMSILNFVSQDELDDLDEDPRIAFSTLVAHAQRRLSERTAALDPRDEGEWEEREELRHSFMNVVIAAAKRFGIEPFASTEVPRLSDFKRSVDYREFRADLDHYVTQLVIDTSVRAKHDSVAILPDTKERIRTYVRALRECIEKASITDSKRDSLLNKLDQFEIEVEKRRLNILAVARVAFELFAIPGAVWASAEVANKLITNVMQVVAEAKSAEAETRKFDPSAPPKALSPPREKEAISARPILTGTNAIDDDIPF